MRPERGAGRLVTAGEETYPGAMIAGIASTLGDTRPGERALAALGALTLVAVGALVASPNLRHRVADWLAGSAGPQGGRRVVVQRVVDGDTFVTGEGDFVRLLGIDAPETVNPHLAHPQPFGPEAAERLRELVRGRTVLLEPGEQPVDHYGRLLGHVWLGRTLVAEVLIGEGLGRAQAIPPNVRHADRLRRAEERARRAAVGLWSIARPTDIPAFRD